MGGRRTRAEFERIMIPHLGAAYNLALWLLRHPHDAEDAVQDAYLQAFRAFHQLSSDNCRAWILKIVRNACISLLRRNKSDKVVRLDSVMLDTGLNAFALEASDNSSPADLSLDARDEHCR